ncbi:MAG TPA: SPOR domain-containing protein [Kofleriaceae bacterium]
MSREAELYKDKIEVSLDGRQIFYLFFGGSVIVGLVFVLGVMVGRRVEARGHTDRARVAATVDPLAALDRLEGGSGLSFQGALRGADGPVSDVEKAISAMPKKDDKRADDKKPEPPKPEAKKEEPKPEEAKKAEPKKDDAKKEEPKLEEAKKAEPKKDDAKKEEPQKDDVKKAEANEPKKDEAKKEEPAKAKFTLQLSSFQDKAEAQAYLESMKAAGYSAYISEGAVDGKQYFRVRTGSYKTMEAANEGKTAIERATKKSAVVMKL